MFICRVCGTHFEKPNRRGRLPVFCSTECVRVDRELKYPRKTNRVNVCEICECSFESVGPGPAAKVCSRACKNEKERLRSLASRPVHYRECEICNTEFETRYKASFACSPECQRERVRLWQKNKWVESLESRPQTKEIICKWCNEPVVVPYSMTGARKYHDACKKQATRAKNRKKSVKRQGAKTQSNIVHEVIAERDNYVCHICGELVDMSLPRRSHYGATLDHVIPIAKGGLDSEDNVKLAHWICNVRKSDKLGDLNG
jgi:hypothetical protein